MSDGVALLNPTQQATAARAMIAVVTDQITTLSNELTSVVLEERKYLQRMGALDALRATHRLLEMEYARHFEV